MLNKQDLQLLQCKALRRDGQPCQGRAIAPDGRCFSHSEHFAEVRREGAVRGGLALQAKLRMLRQDDLPLNTVEECEESLKRIILAVASGRMEDTQGRTLAALIKLKMECGDWRRIQEELDEE